MQEPAHNDHEAGETLHTHDHRGSQPTGTLVRLDRIDNLNAHNRFGIGTTSSDLQALLVPGTIVHFWASWCRPCEEEFPQLDRFHRGHIMQNLEASGIRLITISNDFTVAPAARFIEKHGVSFPVYLDPEQASNLVVVGQRQLPSTVMVGADGRFHRLALGKLDWDFPRLLEVLTAIAALKPDAGNNTENPKQRDD
jgi:peroxiredoxin